MRKDAVLGPGCRVRRFQEWLKKEASALSQLLRTWSLRVASVGKFLPRDFKQLVECWLEPQLLGGSTGSLGVRSSQLTHRVNLKARQLAGL